MGSSRHPRLLADLLRREQTDVGVQTALGGGAPAVGPTGSVASPPVPSTLLTTKGDLIGRDATAPVRVPVGADGQVLTADAASAPGVKWAAGGGGGGTSSFTKIDERVLGADAATIDFSGIPGNYEDLRLVVQGRSSAAAVQDVLSLRMNGDAGANYDFTVEYISNAGAAADVNVGQTSAELSSIAAATAPADAADAVVVDIPKYARTVFQKGFTTLGGVKQGTTVGSIFARHAVGYWRSLAAINRLTLLLTTGSFKAGTVATLYGIGGTPATVAPSVLPTGLAGLKGWWRADSLTTNVDGDLIATWPDQSGNGADLVGTLGQRPTFKTNIVNGKPVLRFDGVANGLRAASVSLTEFLVLIVAKVTTMRMLYEHSDNANTNDGSYLYDNTNTLSARRGAAQVSADLTAGWNGARPGFEWFEHSFSQGAQTLRRNGVPIIVASGPVSIASTAAPFNVGSRAQASLFTAADIAEVIVFSTVPSLDDLDAIRRYLASKYGLEKTVGVLGVGVTTGAKQSNPVIPGLAASPDIASTGPIDEEFDTTVAAGPPAGWVVTANAPSTLNVNTQAKSHLYIKQTVPAAATHRFSGITRAAPAIPFTMTAKLSSALLNRTNFLGAGIAVGDGATGAKGLLIRKMHNVGWEVRVDWYNPMIPAGGGDAAAGVNGNGDGEQKSMPLYLRIVVNAANNIDLLSSLDGLIYTPLNLGVNFLVAASQVFLVVDTLGGPMEGMFDWVRFS